MYEKFFEYSECEPISLEKFLKSEGISSRMLKKLKRTENGITRNGELIRSIDEVHMGDKIRIAIEEKSEIVPNGKIKAKILYEDENAVVFDKSPYLAVHPSHRHYDDTLGNYFAYLYKDKIFRPINRLDRDTSGAVLVAKNQSAAMKFQKNMKKTYYAVVMGKLEGSGRIDLPIARKSDTIILRQVDKNGKRAITNYEVIESSDKYSLLKINLETGKTHQIRVHFSYLGYPLYGDELYGGNHDLICRQALHCGEIEFKDEEIIHVQADLPNDIKKLLRNLK